MSHCKECKRESDTSLCDACDRLIDDLARVTAERDTSRRALANLGGVVQSQADEIIALRAEVEAMRAVVEAARPVAAGDGHPSVMRSRLAVAMTALDALRAGKGTP